MWAIIPGRGWSHLSHFVRLIVAHSCLCCSGVWFCGKTMGSCPCTVVGDAKKITRSPCRSRKSAVYHLISPGYISSKFCRCYHLANLCLYHFPRNLREQLWILPPQFCVLFFRSYTGSVGSSQEYKTFFYMHWEIFDCNNICTTSSCMVLFCLKMWIHKFGLGENNFSVEIASGSIVCFLTENLCHGGQMWFITWRRQQSVWLWDAWKAWILTHSCLSEIEHGGPWFVIAIDSHCSHCLRSWGITWQLFKE